MLGPEETTCTARTKNSIYERRPTLYYLYLGSSTILLLVANVIGQLFLNSLLDNYF